MIKQLSALSPSILVVKEDKPNCYLLLLLNVWPSQQREGGTLLRTTWLNYKLNTYLICMRLINCFLSALCMYTGIIRGSKSQSHRLLLCSWAQRVARWTNFSPSLCWCHCPGAVWRVPLPYHGRHHFLLDCHRWNWFFVWLRSSRWIGLNGVEETSLISQCCFVVEIFWGSALLPLRTRSTLSQTREHPHSMPWQAWTHSAL